MTKLHLDFRIDFYDDWEGYKEFEKSVDSELERTSRILAKMDFEEQKRKKIYNSHGFKYFSGVWSEIELNDISAKRIMKMVEGLKSAHIGYLGSGILIEKLTEGEMEESEWFMIYTRYSDALNQFDEYPTCKAYQCPPMVHILNHNQVSERFKQVVEDNDLSGLDFLWFKDVGKYKAPQWFWAIPHQPLGHGLDHEWFDRNRYRDYALSPNSPLDEGMKRTLSKDLIKEYVKGETHFDSRYFKSDWTTGADEIDDLLSLFLTDSSGRLNVHSIPRYQRKYLPTTDFVYVWNIPGTSLCINRKARDILYDNKIIVDGELIGILQHDNVPKGTENLDKERQFPYPLSYRKDSGPDFLSNLKEKEKKLLKEFLKIKKPIRKPNIKRSLQILRKSKKNRPDDFKRGISKKKLDEAIQQLSYKLPIYWMDALKISNGGWFGINKENYTCEITSVQDLNQFHFEINRDRKMSDEDYNEKLIYFGQSDCGDYFAFKKEEQSGLQDCPVHLISHEDFSLMREWEGIADFLESILIE